MIAVGLLLVAATWVPGVAVRADTMAGVQLLGTMPADGSEVERPPEVARAVFATPVEPVDTGVEVHDARGERVDEGLSDPLPSPVVVEAVLPSDLPAGSYEASWRVRSPDGDTAEGSWSFAVLDDPEASATGPGRGAWIAAAVLAVLLSTGGLWFVVRRRR